MTDQKNIVLKSFSKYEKKIAIISIIVIFLALIRCISEFYRLEHTLQDNLTIETVKPFITGALVAAISAFIMVVLYFLSQYKFILIIGIVAIILMLVIKRIYLIQD